MKPNNSFKQWIPISIFTIGVIVIGLCSYLADRKNHPERYYSNSSNNNGSTNSNVCKRCGGSGVVATYSYCTDPAKHFHGDCSPETHDAICTASGSKTCPCCNGSGKN